MTRRIQFAATTRFLSSAGFGRLRARGAPRWRPEIPAIKSVAEALEVSSRTVRRWIESGDLVVPRGSKSFQFRRRCVPSWRSIAKVDP